MSSTGNNEKLGSGEERENFQSWGKRCRKDMVKLARYLEINSPDGDTDDEDDMESQGSVEDNGEEVAEDNERMGEASSRDEDEGAIAHEGAAGGFHPDNENVEVAEEDIREGNGNEYEAGEEVDNGAGNSSKTGKSEETCSKACLKKIEALENEVKHWKEAFVAIRNRQFILENTFKEFHGNYAKFSKSINNVLENLEDNIEKEGNQRQNTPGLESDRSSDMIDVFLRSMNESNSMRSSPAISVISLPNENQEKAITRKREMNSPQPGPSSRPHPFSPAIHRSSLRRGLASSPALSVASSSSSVVVLSPPPPKKQSVGQTGYNLPRFTHSRYQEMSVILASNNRMSTNSVLNLPNLPLPSQPAQALTLSGPQNGAYSLPQQQQCMLRHNLSCPHHTTLLFSSSIGNVSFPGNQSSSAPGWVNNGYLQPSTSSATERTGDTILVPIRVPRPAHNPIITQTAASAAEGQFQLSRNAENHGPETNYGRYYNTIQPPHQQTSPNQNQ